MSSQQGIADSDVLDGLSIRYLKFFGLWSVINEYRTTGKRNGIIKLKLFITLLLSIPYIFSQYLSYFIIEVDLQKATFLNLHSLPALQICSKVLVFWFRIDNVCKLYNLIRKDFLSLPEHKRDGAKCIYMKITKTSNMLCKAAFIVNSSIVALYVMQPGISVDYILHHTGNMAAVKGGRQKIMHGWYPLPIDRSPYYEAIFVYETMLIIWDGILLAVYDSLFYQLLMCLYAQFTVLGFHLSTLKIVASQDPNSRLNDSNSPIYRELYKIIKDHKKLISYANELRSIYNPLVTIILGMGIFVLIIAVFQFLFGGTRSPLFIFRSLLFLVYQGIEVSMFCFGSSSIEKASSDLQFAIYSSDWYKADIKFRKTAQMMMMRARKGVTLTALRMYPVNVETIMSILQFTYSVTALMSRKAEIK
ncbi:odorant receptor 24a-like [Halyomorpha halys]|uniref:odorant receptor 24a-like n=1 Tax=Halyomorpha halys TaxID=286706 RepID=UPI0006D4D235|nr:Odorant receptor 39 [Halyomorpha halys]